MNKRYKAKLNVNGVDLSVHHKDPCVKPSKKILRLQSHQSSVMDTHSKIDEPRKQNSNQKHQPSDKTHASWKRGYIRLCAQLRPMSGSAVHEVCCITALETL